MNYINRCFKTVQYIVIGPLLLGPRLYDALSQAHHLRGPICIDRTAGKPRTVWAYTLLLFKCVLGYLNGALGNIADEHHLVSTFVRNNQNRPHPHEDFQKAIMINPLKRDYKQRKGRRKRGQTLMRESERINRGEEETGRKVFGQ